MLVEIAGESRGFDITNDSISQTFTYKIVDLDEDFVTADTGFFGPEDDTECAKYIYSTFPPIRNFPVSPTETTALFIGTVHASNPIDNHWTVTITYTLPQGNEAKDYGYIQYGFESGGDTVHITQSYSVRSSAARTGSGLTPPDWGGAIGVSKNGVEGVDVPARGLRFNITGFFVPGDFATSLAKTWGDLAGYCNNATFLSFAAGEVMFLNCAGQGEQYKVIPIQFNFLHKQNLNGVTDPGFSALYAYGHDVIDYQYRDVVNGDYTVQRPTFRYVHEVAKWTNFAIFGLT